MALQIQFLGELTGFNTKCGCIFLIVNALEDVLERFDRDIDLGMLRAVHLNDSLNPLGNRKDRHAKAI
jgi:endonuclease IV